jgi:hypothetical protein
MDYEHYLYTKVMGQMAVVCWHNIHPEFDPVRFEKWNHFQLENLELMNVAIL